VYALYVPNAEFQVAFADLRAKILELFGKEADRLALLFATVDVKKLIADDIAVNKSDGTTISLETNDKQYLRLFETANNVRPEPIDRKPPEAP